MGDYSKAYREYCSVIEQCILSSQKYMNISSPTAAHFYASVLFTRLCTYSVSIKKLSPDPASLGKMVHWDFGSVASLTRNVIECYLTFYYLCVEKCPVEEWNARWKLMNLHDHMSRSKMFESFGEDVENNDLANEIEEEVVTELRKNSWFKKLPEKQQIHFLKGKVAFFKSKDEIIKSCGREVSEFRGIYRFLSSNIHTAPMGFYRMAEHDNGRGVESRVEVNYKEICLEIAKNYLETANTEFVQLFESTLKV